MKRFLVILIFLTFAASAEVVITEGNYLYTGNITENEACLLAKGKAKLKALEKDILIQKIENSDEQSYICKIKIQAEVIKTAQTLDNSFDFNVKLNEKNFKEGDELKIDLILSKPIYLNIFQILPYETKDFQVHKIFPNELDDKNYLTDKSVSLPMKAKYEVYFPNNINKKSVDEYLFIIGSEKDIKWLEKYTKIEDLKNAYIREKSIIYKYKSYTIYK